MPTLKEKPATETKGLIKKTITILTCFHQGGIAEHMHVSNIICS